MQARGRKGQLLLDFETSFGQTPSTPTSKIMPFSRSQLRSTQNLQEDETIRNNRNPAMPTRGNVDASGQIVVPLDVIAIGYWLRAMFGEPETSGIDSFTHVFKPGDTQESIVLEQGFTDIGVYELFNGCKVSRFSLTAGGEGSVNTTIDIIGAKETVGNSSFDPDASDITLTKYNQFQATLDEGGESIVTATEVELNIDLALDGDQYVIGGEGIRGDIPEGIIQISGRVVALFENTTLLNKAINGIESSLKLTWTSGTNSLEFMLPEILYERNSPGIEGSRGILLDLPFRAYYENAAEEAAVQVTLVNNQSTY